MSAVVGVVLLSASILGAILGALLFRNPQRPAWARSTSLSDLAALVLVGLFAFGTACLTSFALGLAAPSAWMVGAGGIVGAIALTWGAWRGMRVSERLAAYDAESESVPLHAARGARDSVRIVSSTDPPGHEPPVRPSGSRGRKAA